MANERTQLIQSDLKGKSLLLYDGDCAFCQFWVNFILKRDKRKHFLFAPLQIQGSSDLCRDNGIEPNGKSVLILDDVGLSEKSTAVLRICSKLGGVWLAFSILGIFIPKFFRDWLYVLVAQRRKSISKHMISFCRVPTLEEKKRFLDQLPG